MKQVAIIFLTIAIAVAVSVFYVQLTRNKTAFIYSQKVFDGFKGTQELKAKLEAVQVRNRSFLDSITVMINAGRTDLIPWRQQKAEQLMQEESALSEQYTAEVWKHINDQIDSFGEKNGYDFIFGALGNGSLMYASPDQDVTDKVITYINERYSAGLR